MKSLFQIVVLLSIIAVGTMPTAAMMIVGGTSPEINSSTGVQIATPTLRIPITAYDSENPSAVTTPPQYRIVDSLFNAFSYLGTTQKPLSWHPGTNTLVSIMRGAFPSIGVTNDNIRNCSDALKIRTSYDGGLTWNDPLYVYADVTINGSGRPRYPSVDIVDPNGSITERSNLHFAFYSTLQTNVDTNTSLWAKKNHIFATQKNVLNPDQFAAFQGVSIASKQYYTGNESAISVTKLPGDDNNYVILAANAYRNVNLNSSDLTDRSPIVGMRYDWQNDLTPRLQTPLEWASDKFAPISSSNAANASSRMNTLVGLDNDGANFYCGVFGAFVQSSGTDTEFRFGFSKSTDNGSTWSEYIVMPVSVLSAYEQANGIAAGQGIFVNQWVANSTSNNLVSSVRDMVVYGNDKLSFIAQIATKDKSSALAHVVEVNYSNGQWAIRKIADTFAPERLDFMNKFKVSRLPDDINEDSIYIQTGNPRGGEHQIVKTADVSRLLVKYLEPRAFVFKFGVGRVNANNEPIIPDTLYTTDVVMASRAANDNSWGTLRNVTNTLMLERGTWIPKIIPNDLTSIPLLTVQNADRSGNEYDANIEHQYRLGTLKGADFTKFKQYITCSSINFPSADPYSQFVVNVREESQPQSLTISPNPASSTATLHYTSTSNTLTKIEILNVLGTVAYSETVSAAGDGEMYHTIDTSVLPIGQYYCRLMQSGITKLLPFVIVR